MVALSTAAVFSEPHVGHPQGTEEAFNGTNGQILTEPPKQMELKVVSSVPFLLLIKSGTFEKSLPIRIKAWL